MRNLSIWLWLLAALNLCAQPGTLDGSFTPGSGPDTSVFTTVNQPDGKILIAGTFDAYNGTARSGIARIHADGSLDTSFNPGTALALASEYIYCMALQPDGKILIGGIFAGFNGVARNNIARLNADGSVDTTFNPGSGANNEVVTISLQSTGKMIVGGLFTQFNGSARRLVRLNPDGSTDNTFAIGGGPNSYVWTTSVLPDDKIYIGGGYSTFNNVSANSIIRLNPDGTRDNTFTNTRLSNNAVLTHAVQPDGKIIIGGYFTNYGSPTIVRNRIARINADGTLDNSFNVGTGLNNYPLTTLCQPNGKILVGGNFTTYNGSTANRIVRLNTDGSVDSSFLSGSGLPNILYKATFQPDGKILLASESLIYNGSSAQPNLTRINGYEPNSLAIASVSAAAPYCMGQSFTVNYTAQGYYAAGNVFSVQLSDAAGSFASPVVVGSLASENLSGSITVTIPLGTPVGNGYRMRLSATNLPVVSADNGSDIALFGDTLFYEDADGDGYGNPDVSVTACLQPNGYVSNADDCNDAEPAAHTGMAEILYDGIDNNCDGNLDEGNQLTTQLLAASCGLTLTSMSQLLGIRTIAPASAITGWRVRLTSGAQVQILEKTVPHFTLTQFASYQYQTTYTVEIELQRNGIWLGYYGPACTVTTPGVLQSGGAATVVAGQCGQTLPKISTLVATTSLPGVTGYRFRIRNQTDPLGANAEQILDRVQNWFNFTSLTRYNYGSAYSIDIAIKTNGDYGPYGAACTVNTPAIPAVSACGQSATSLSQPVSVASLPGVTQYRFEVTRQLDNASQIIDRGVNYFTFSGVSPQLFTAGAAYSIRVAVMTSGQWSPYGNPCTVTAPGAAARPATAETNEVLVWKALPNPFTQHFSLTGNDTEQSAVNVKVYDMLGRLVESQTATAQSLQELHLGTHYPTGIYNVVVEQSSGRQVFRMIKR